VDEETVVDAGEVVLAVVGDVAALVLPLEVVAAVDALVAGVDAVVVVAATVVASEKALARPTPMPAAAARAAAPVTRVVRLTRRRSWSRRWGVHCSVIGCSRVSRVSRPVRVVRRD
jgi:hypothetical protein